MTGKFLKYTLGVVLLGVTLGTASISSALTITIDQDTDFHSGCFTPYQKAAIPDIEGTEGEDYTQGLRPYFAAGLPDTDDCPDVGDINIVWSVSSGPSGCAIDDTTDAFNPTLDCTPFTGGSYPESGTMTLGVGNAVDTGANPDVSDTASYTIASSGGGGGTPVAANTLRVATDGNDSTQCTLENPCASLTRLSAISKSTGQDICLTEGDIWTNQKYVINHDGTSGDPVRFETCYQEGGNWYFWSEGPSPETASKATIKGGLVDGCWDNAIPDCDFSDDAFTVLNSLNDAHLKPNGDYQHVSAIKLTNSRGRAMTAKGADSGGDGVLTGLRITNMEWSNSGWAMIVENDVYDVVIKDNTFIRWALCEAQEWNGNDSSLLPSGGSGNCGASGAPSGITVARSDGEGTALGAQVLIEGNTVGPGWGEGINCLDSSNIWIIGNRVSNTRSGGIYLDSCTHAVVEQNISIGHGGTNTCGTATTDGCNEGTGTNTNTENTAAPSDVGPHLIRNNVNITTDRCFNIAMGSNSREANPPKQMFLEFYGNTCLANIGDFMPAAWRSTHGDSYDWQVLEAKSNYTYTEEESNYCDRMPAGTDGGFEYNGWPGATQDDDCDDAATDTITASLPAGFSSYATIKGFDYQDSNTTILNAINPSGDITTVGDPDLETEEHDLPFGTYFIDSLWEASELKCGSTKSDWNKKLKYYRDCTARDASTPGIGALP